MKTKLKAELPIISNVSFKDQKDGSSIMTFDHDERFVEWFKMENPSKKPTKKNMGDFLLNILAKAVTKTDGYDIQKPKK